MASWYSCRCDLVLRSEWWHNREKSSGQSISCWSEHHIWISGFLLTLENTNISSTPTNTRVQNNRRLLSVRYCPCSSPVNDNPQGTVIIIRLGAIIYGSTSCPLSSSQTGFTILSYTISDLSLCSSDRLSVWPFYHLNGKDSFKKSPMGVLREEEDQVAINLTSLGTWAM